MTNVYSGQCSCGRVKVLVDLPLPIENFESRACDCKFCAMNAVEYLSHPEAHLTIEAATLKIQQQGSEQAEFLSCSACHDVIAASYQYSDKIIGAVNATLLQDFTSLKGSQIISPRVLNPEEKLKRWSEMWLSVSIVRQ